MSKEGQYTAQEASDILLNEGLTDITKRTINYYAFDKNMFEVSGTGKKCFTDEDLDKIRAIKLLRENTNYTLDQIKQIINSKSLEEITQMCTQRVIGYLTQSYSKGVSSSTGLSMSSPPSMESQVMINSVNTIRGSLLSTEREQQSDETGKRTIKINEDVTLILSDNVDTDKLRKIINFIRELK